MATVMTGNVTQVTLDLSKLLFTRNGDVSTKNVRKQIGNVTIFLMGCLIGANATSSFGLWTVWKTIKAE